ncbi:dihydroorotate dehydrogenase electron transfer subunit [Salinarimonas rosea]|uniref:dihydroorotate dehydrogenase electron transfer subunit n=1 Tax=Salinarimonas rosea TaxID=552063 RepID=UPI0004194708|nr:dihydroorotate dehydrogenase electron transfer subunit [Salinarimonas rosea]
MMMPMLDPDVVPPAAPARPVPGRPLEIEALVREHVCVNDEYRYLSLDLPDGVPHARPGQFYHLLCPGGDGLEPFFRRPMSVYRVEPERNRVGFLYKVTGTGTAAMARLWPGDGFNIFGPLGIGFTLPADTAPIVLLGRGVGLATMGPLVPFARENGHRVTAVLSARAPELLMSVEEMRIAGADVLTVTDSEGTSAVPHVEGLLEDLVAQGRCGALYVCGSSRLTRLAQSVAARHGLFGEVALEQQMACGVGVCFCCVRPFRENGETVHRRVCCEGPVFPLAEALA